MYDDFCYRCGAIVAQFLDLDLENDDVNVFLKDFVLSTTNGLG